jgi:hypothetical protein
MDSRVDFRICKDCRRKRKRISDGKFDATNRRYKDDDNLTWNGNRCGACHKTKMKIEQRERRKKVAA